MEEKPHTLNIQILLLRQKCMQFVIGIKITFIDHMQIATLCDIYIHWYTRIFVSSMVIPIYGLNDFNIELANSVTESLRSGESAVTVTCFISAKYLCSGIFRMLKDLCHYLGFLCPYLSLDVSSPANKYETMSQWWGMLDQHYKRWTSVTLIGSTSRICWASPAVCRQ